LKYIAIIRPCAIGDLIVTLPALFALRKFYPNAHIEIIGYPSYLELVHGRFYANSVSRFDRADIAVLFRKNLSPRDSIAERFSHIDLIIAFLSGKKELLSENLYALGVKKVLCHDPLPDGSGLVHITDHILKSLDLLEIPYSDNTPKIYLNEEDHDFAKCFIERHIPENAGHLIAIHPGSGSRYKCWPIEKFAEITQWLHDTINAYIFIISGPADEMITRNPLIRCKKGCTILERMPLSKVAAILRRCDLFIGNDSGITHMAAALETPTLALFGPTNPHEWGPRGNRVNILYKKTYCSPCAPKVKDTCAEKTCFENIGIGDLKKEIEAVLNIPKDTLCKIKNRLEHKKSLW